MNNLIFGGPMNTGKSTTYNAVKQDYQEDERFLFVDEEARKLILLKEKPINEYTSEEIGDMQMDLVEHSIRKECQAAENDQIAIFDSSLIENIAYIQGHVKESIYKTLNKILASRAHSYNYIYFPPKSRIKLQADGVRHIDAGEEQKAREFQLLIANRIKLLLREHNIRTYQMDRVDPQVRSQIASRMLERLAQEQDESVY